jgi:hypothetical protein
VFAGCSDAFDRPVAAPFPRGAVNRPPARRLGAILGLDARG